MKPAPSIWIHAAAYFGCYAPYVALTKLLSAGVLVAGHRVAPAALLPISTLASGVGMVAFITWRGWWRYADRVHVGGRSWPAPDAATALSGVATSAVIATTTLSYSVSASVLFMMVLMRGGVLAMAPLVDWASSRSVRPRSWIALALSGASLAVGAWGAGSDRFEVGAIVVVLIYLASYAVRLHAMSKQAKSDDAARAIRFFVQEQMVATPALAVFLGLTAMLQSPWRADLRHGFTAFDSASLWMVAIGLLSQGTGIFGALVLLDGRENAYCVPLNRASSVLAGLVATAVMGVGFGVAPPTPTELVGAALLIAALVVLGRPSRRTPAPTAPSRHVACERSEA